LTDLQGNIPSKTPRSGLVTLGALEARRFDIRFVPKVFKQIPIELLQPGVLQPRRDFKSQSLKELASSLLATGINMTPLVVRPKKGSENFDIISGGRRWRAGQMATLTHLLCCVGDFTDEQALYISGVDNIQREDLNALEEAYSFQQLINAGLTQAEVASEIGKSREHVTHYLRLLKLPLAVRDLVADAKLSYAQARPLCSLKAPGLQVEIAKKAVEKGWTSKKIVELVAGLNAKRKQSENKPREKTDFNIERLKQRVSEQTGYPCGIEKTEKGVWKIALAASSADEFEGILARLGVDTSDL
jgi:ParB family chromosome partitioning protein